MIKLNYSKINKVDLANGEGVRVTLFVSGCTCHCKGCFNKETWDFNSGVPFDENAKKELFEALDKPYIQGVTFSGGHPLENENISTVYELCKEIKEKFPTKDIWLYTGYKFEDITSYLIMKYIDVLVDGRYIEEERDVSLPFCGSKNQRVILVQESLQKGKVVLYESKKI